RRRSALRRSLRGASIACLRHDLWQPTVRSCAHGGAHDQGSPAPGECEASTEMARLQQYVTAGRTRDNWQSLKTASVGDIAVWYVAGRQVYTAWSWVSGPSVHVAPGEPFGPCQGPVAGIQWLPAEISRKAVLDASDVDGGRRQGPQTVPDEK